MSDWAKKTAERLVAVETENQEHIVRSEDEKSILKFKAPRLWQGLRDWLKANCERLNAETGRKILEFELWPTSEARIRRIDRPAQLFVEFDQDAHRVRYSCGSGRAELHFDVNLDGSVVFADPYHRQFTVEHVGEMILNSLLTSPFGPRKATKPRPRCSSIPRVFDCTLDTSADKPVDLSFLLAWLADTRDSAFPLRVDNERMRDSLKWKDSLGANRNELFFHPKMPKKVIYHACGTAIRRQPGSGN
jgi:hypothetical protein